MEHVNAAASNAGEIAQEVFVLTDEQIVGLGSDGPASDVRLSTPASPSAQFESAEQPPVTPYHLSPLDQSHTPEPSATATTQVPQWLAERMQDPRDAAAAKEFWEGKQRAEAEVAAYREVFATAADARTFKEIYPGGLAEAKASAERARELEAIDAAFFHGDSSSRLQLADKMMRQDPRAFREMLEAGVRLLGAHREEKSLAFDSQAMANPPAQHGERAQASSPPKESPTAQQPQNPSPEVVRAYREFERATNTDLERSVGAAITRLMDQALPNLRVSGVGEKEGALGMAPLRDRLSAAVREEVDVGLRSDRQLGEQVSRLLSGHRFDDSTRSQVVRLIDARAQQLLPGAVRKVVGSWTQATLSARGKRDAAPPADAAPSVSRASDRSDTSPRPTDARRPEMPATRSRRIDYGKLSDEQILGL